MHRRAFLAAALLGAVSAFGSGLLAGAGTFDPPVIDPRQIGRPRLSPRPFPPPSPLPPYFLAPALTRIPLDGGTLFGLPGDGNLLALTVDDGNSSEVVAAYTRWLERSGMRLTFFLNGSMPSWTDSAPALRPLVASGQVQLANHTWSHIDLTRASRGQIQDELMHNDTYIRDTYGVEARPYFRPPYGYINGHVISAAASVGYTQPVMWYGTFSDALEIPDETLMQYASQYLLPQHIVIGHANAMTVTRHFADIEGIIRGRGLVPVTLDDVFLRP